MTPSDNHDEFPPIAPEHKAKMIAHFRETFVAERLMAYIRDDDEKFPIEQVLAEADKLEADYAASRKVG